MQFLVLQGLLEELLRGLGCSRLLIQVLAQPQRIFLAQLLLVAHMAVVVVVRGLIYVYGPFLLSHQRGMVPPVFLTRLIGQFRPFRRSQLLSEGVIGPRRPVRVVGHYLVTIGLVEGCIGSFGRHDEDVLDSDVIGL